MTVRIKEWLSLLLSCSHLCLLSLWGGQQEFPFINQGPMRGVSHQPQLLTSQNAVEIKKQKSKTKTRQASPECHRCPRIDFFPVSGRKWARNYCLARGSTKLDSLCVCSQQSVSKVNLNRLWSISTYSYKLAFFLSAVNEIIPHLSTVQGSTCI